MWVVAAASRLRTSVPAKSSASSTMLSGAIQVAVHSWHRQSSTTSELERWIDGRLAFQLDKDRDRAIRARKKPKDLASQLLQRACPWLRPTSVLSEEAARQLTHSRKEDVVSMAAYFERAAAVPPVVDHGQFEVCGRVYDLPRITLQEPATCAELAAMDKLYATRKMFGDASTIKVHPCLP